MKKIFLLVPISILISLTMYGQNSISNNIAIDYTQPKEFVIGGITVSGVKHLNSNTLIELSGLVVGNNITIPSDKISTAIKKLWKQGLFAHVDITVEKVVGNTVFLGYRLYLRSHLFVAVSRYIGEEMMFNLQT